MVKQGRAAIIVPQAIKTFRAPQDASRIYFDIVESGSRAQTVTCNAYGANDKTRFSRVGRTGNPLEEQVHSILVDKTQNPVQVLRIWLVVRHATDPEVRFMEV